ncbi:unnamed protein product [Bursaphelenchus okinawaensis]|uniref:BZIP domain-containing protein n=1 Tax=Bursaphelenchus okinawaensis TaxID=465554 RepID=A0A811L873_9BILA|nr:unnamed protein product [Bursaphelenchus okinawaensis]CAG9119117.1 unnamed protein product [Bursaphelenchus okinawaensis]
MNLSESAADQSTTDVKPKFNSTSTQNGHSQYLPPGFPPHPAMFYNPRMGEMPYPPPMHPMQFYPYHFGYDFGGSGMNAQQSPQQSLSPTSPSPENNSLEDAAPSTAASSSAQVPQAFLPPSMAMMGSPELKYDPEYRLKRAKNNEAAKKSRKRRALREMEKENKIEELQKRLNQRELELAEAKAELKVLRLRIADQITIN